jgi:secondary thiamine-phosphate synthase enzyme
MNGNDFVIESNRICWDAGMFKRTIRMRTHREGDVIDLTDEVKSVISESGIKTGLVHLFVQHSTAALTMIEFEPGVLLDLKRALSVLAPDTADYAHDSRWGDGNGRSHVKAALVGPSLTIPIENGNLLCGTWQQIVLLELDVNAGRERTIVCTVTGD